MTGTRTKIVCTLGPSSNSEEVIRRLVRAGMNVARLNFSHGSHEEHRQLLRLVRRAAESEGQVVAVMADLQGPKIRVGRFREGQARLERGARFTITSRPVEGGDTIVSTSYEGLPKDLREGDTVLLDDGLLSLKVVSRTDTDLECEVITGGVLKNNKGINSPGAPLSVATLTPKDMEDLDFAAREEVDYIAMSFVRRPTDVSLLRERLKALGASIPIVAKIEKPEAIRHIDEIIAITDGIMVARGDLGVELPPEEVPAIQKMIIAKCNAMGVPVITATQMLDSMVNNPRPTRAEASDVANAILDGTDAVMLSAESASGRYPVDSVEVMRRIIQATELAGASALRPVPVSNGRVQALPINEGIAGSACTLAEQVQAGCIVSITLSGSMARSIAKHRPRRPIFAISQHEASLRQLALVWGIEGLWMADLTESIDDVVRKVESMLKELGRIHPGERFVLTAGLPFSERKATNMVRVDIVH